MRLLQKEKSIPKWKEEEVEELIKLMKEYPVIAIVNSAGLPANLLQKVKVLLHDKVGDKVKVKSVKNNLFLIALDKSGIKGKEKLKEKIKEQKIFIFSKINPFLLNLYVEKIKLPAPAKAGMKVEKEIVVEPMDTHLQPGPLLSAFGKLRIPTKVQNGTIWIAKRTVLAKPGDIISSDLASMLQRLGIYPGTIGLKIEYALDDGVLIPAESLKLNIEEYVSQISSAVYSSLALGAEIAYPEPEILKISISNAYRRAIGLSVEVGFITKENADAVISAAFKKALAVVASLGEKAKELGLESISVAAPAAAPAPAEQKKEEKKEEKEEEKKELSEEELASGLGALFG